MDIIKAINLKKYYTSDTYEVRALDGVSLSVERLSEESIRQDIQNYL